MKGRKRRLSPLLIEAAAPVGDASDPAPPLPVEITGETASPRSIRPGLRQYNTPTLQQPPQPWLDQSDTPLPLRVSKEQERPTATGGGSPPIVPPSDGDTAGASWSDTRATFAGEGAFSAYATVVSPPEPDAGILAASAEQRPAAYRFELRDGKIDVLPEAPEPEDREFALDTYRELLAKVRELHERLKGTNSAGRVCVSIERLLVGLGTSFDDVRPPVLLSRSRSIEADRAALADELLPDVIAMIDDVLQSLRDLMAMFPIVRRVEVARLALGLHQNADAVPNIQQQMAEIKATAAKSEAVTENAIIALTYNDAAIEDATDPVERTSLVADELLVFSNFVRKVTCEAAQYARKAGTELAGLGGDIWKAIRVGLPPLVPPAALVGLAVWISGPVTGLAAAVATFKPMAEILKSLSRDQKPSTPKKRPKRGKSR
jgi:hypothetical protein